MSTLDLNMQQEAVALAPKLDNVCRYSLPKKPKVGAMEPAPAKRKPKLPRKLNKQHGAMERTPIFGWDNVPEAKPKRLQLPETVAIPVADVDAQPAPRRPQVSPIERAYVYTSQLIADFTSAHGDNFAIIRSRVVDFLIQKGIDNKDAIAGFEKWRLEDTKLKADQDD